MAADLHIHSIYSDGSFTPEELVKMAEQKNIDTIAVADHDTVDGIEPALKAGKKAGIKVIPAIEFSTFRGKAEIHILGYFIDYRNKKLLDKIDEIFTARIERAKKMMAKLNKLGVDISYQEVKGMAGDEYIGRPHIARAMVNAGYINDMKDAFTEQYIGNNGRAYVDKFKMPPEEAVELIREIGGIPVLAHPVFINHGQPLEKKEIAQLVESGLMGIEVYHTKHMSADVNYYKRAAEDLNLIITGGSDFHGENSPGVELGDVELPAEYVKKLFEFKNSLI